MTSVIIIGAGGHTNVLLDILQNFSKVKILGILDNNPKLINQIINDVPVIGDDNDVKQFSPKDVKLINGIGSVSIPQHRQAIYQKFKSLHYEFFSVIHPSACIAKNVVLGEGVQVMAGSIIQAGSKIGNNVIVNTRAVIDHDCCVNDHVHIAPGATLSGQVNVGETTHIGTGATVIQGINLGSQSLIAAGAVVVRDVPSSYKVKGVPAREFVT